MLRKLFIGLIMLYFIGNATDVIRTYFVLDEITAICSTGDCEEEKAETSGLDEESDYFTLTLQQSTLFLLHRSGYPFKAKALLPIALIRFSPPPERV